ncbi:MAG: hypothetical protein ACRC4H_16495, partial [Plesiomonas sp.]
IRMREGVTFRLTYSQSVTNKVSCLSAGHPKRFRLIAPCESKGAYMNFMVKLVDCICTDVVEEG